MIIEYRGPDFEKRKSAYINFETNYEQWSFVSFRGIGRFQRRVESDVLAGGNGKAWVIIRCPFSEDTANRTISNVHGILWVAVRFSSSFDKLEPTRPQKQRESVVNPGRMNFWGMDES